ncbi:MAG: hypothetical protein H0V76_07610 [Blastocatellia bacterium]|nr:hypothetical protein [Blastocatellia bacterium]
MNNTPDAAASGATVDTSMPQILLTFANHAMAGVLAVVAFYLSLVTTSLPPAPHEQPAIDRAVAILEEKGFNREVFLLRNTVTFRSTDHWLNAIVEKENAYASTNFPFQIITVYPDFHVKTVDDTERAMILLHEARHLMGEGEKEAYGYVWQNRHRLGWTQLSHGTTPSYITVSELTREYAPELFTCSDKLWGDCTERGE